MQEVPNQDQADQQCKLVFPVHSIEMQIPLFQLIMGAVRGCVLVCACICVCGCVGEDVRVGEILTHLLTCFSNGVQMGFLCGASKT